MASGQVYRANRPNTWLLRPLLQSEAFLCQPASRHFAAISTSVAFGVKRTLSRVRLLYSGLHNTPPLALESLAAPAARARPQSFRGRAGDLAADTELVESLARNLPERCSRIVFLE
jgi:hypothetical protein